MRVHAPLLAAVLLKLAICAPFTFAPPSDFFLPVPTRWAPVSMPALRHRPGSSPCRCRRDLEEEQALQQALEASAAESSIQASETSDGSAGAGAGT